MQCPHVAWIHRNWEGLVKQMDTTTLLLNHLEDRQVLNRAEREEILAEQVPSHRSNKLLTQLVRTTPEQFQRFIDTLHTTGQGYIADAFINKCGMSLAVSTN